MLLAINCVCSKDLHGKARATRSGICMREISILLLIGYFIYSNTDRRVVHSAKKKFKHLIVTVSRLEGCDSGVTRKARRCLVNVT
jgi:hypothetical protein